MDRTVMVDERMVLVTLRCKHGCLGGQYLCRPFPEALTGFLNVSCSNIPGHLADPPRPGDVYVSDFFQCARCGKLHLKGVPPTGGYRDGAWPECACGEPFPREYVDIPTR